MLQVGIWLGVVILLGGFAQEAQAKVAGCFAEKPYKPSAPPRKLTPDRSRKTTVVMLHGKNSSQWTQAFDPLITFLLKKRYRLLVPQLPWGKEWDGTMCQGLNYVDKLVRAERRKGRQVVVLGHSFGGTHALIYAARAKRNLKGIVVIGPGHMLPLAKAVIEETRTQVAKAKRLERVGKANRMTKFTTKNTGDEINEIRTTPRIYLSYHDVNRFADMTKTLPKVRKRLLWMVGDKDPILPSYNNSNLLGYLPRKPGYKYKILNGGHRDVFGQVGPATHKWLKGR